MNVLKEIEKERNGKLPLIDRLYNSLLREILTGILPAGTKLTESKLCEDYNISRTPVREALKQLETNGLIVFIPNRGAFVKGFTSEEIEDLMKLRIDMEVQAVKLGIERITEEEEAQMAEIFSHMEFYTRKNDIPKMIDINIAFHRMIYLTSHNSILYNTLVSWQTYIHYCRPSNYFARGYLDKILEEHRKIYNAYLSKNPDAGAKAMRQHMNNSFKRRI